MPAPISRHRGALPHLFFSYENVLRLPLVAQQDQEPTSGRRAAEGPHLCLQGIRSTALYQICYFGRAMSLK